MNSGIYIIKSTINDKCYVGSAISIIRRIRDHKNFLRNDKHYNKKLQNHYNKYGIDSLSYNILEYCDKSILIEREQYFIDNLRPFFNICKIAGTTLGITYKIYEPTKEKKKKISNSRKGKPRGYSVTVHKGGSNVNSKRVERTDINGVKKIYDSLSSVNDDGFIFQNVYRAIKKRHKHHGYTWRYL